jgi:uncharacterized protein YbaR (Trm112 family)/SAM-dependent methyltransferase
MKRWLLNILCDPISKQSLELRDAVANDKGDIVEGTLVSASGARYPIRNGIPRFSSDGTGARSSVESFGREWNFFNFTQFKTHWLAHTVRSTFGSVDAFKSKIVVDAGAGSGAQTLWMLEAGAQHVIALELSDSVDDVVQRNLVPSGFDNFDVIQCSIDNPPLKPRSIDGLVYCHNVIQHTPSVEKTARALFELVGQGGELAFNCYPLNDDGLLRWIRFHLIYKPTRKVVSSLPFAGILTYARLMGVLREIPVLGVLLEKGGVCVQGDVPHVEGESWWPHKRRRFRATVLNTFDGFGSHTFQHHKSEAEIRALVRELQPDSKKVLNVEAYFSRPPPIGCALRVFR